MCLSRHPPLRCGQETDVLLPLQVLQIGAAARFVGAKDGEETVSSAKGVLRSVKREMRVGGLHTMLDDLRGEVCFARHAPGGTGPSHHLHNRRHQGVIRADLLITRRDGSSFDFPGTLHLTPNPKPQIQNSEIEP